MNYIVVPLFLRLKSFVLSKTDLTDSYEELAGIIIGRFQECPVEKTSIYQTNMEKALYNHWHESETAVFLGSSGVGKSSLIKNRMLETDAFGTGEYDSALYYA